jgi:hypothetical protein
MEIEIKKQRRKSKVVGIRLYKEDYDLISAIAKEKHQAESFVAESLIRAAMGSLKEGKHLPSKFLEKNISEWNWQHLLLPGMSIVTQARSVTSSLL